MSDSGTFDKILCKGRMWLVFFCSIIGVIGVIANNETRTTSCVDNQRRGVLISYGRSGSEAILEAIYKLTDSTVKMPQYEILGHSPEDMERGIKENPSRVIKSWYRDHMKDYPGEIAVFKWKPHCFDDAEYLNILHYLSKECIPVIYSHRNQLDVHISQHKHSEQSGLEAHCHEGDEKCLKAHMNVRVNIKMDHILDSFKKHEEEHAIIMHYLTLKRIRFMELSYEELFFDNYLGRTKRLTRWEEMLKFIDPEFPKNRNITIQDLTLGGEAVTHSSSRNVTVTNYFDVKSQALKEHPEYAIYFDENNFPPFHNLTAFEINKLEAREKCSPRNNKQLI